MEVKYVMVTHWDDHWNNLKNQETYYTENMIEKEVNINNLVENASTLFITTLFIKLEDRGGNKFGPPQRAWIGYAYGFRKERDEIHFKVKIDKEVPLSKVPEEYLLLSPGWYLKDWYLLEEEVVLPECFLYPPFFYSLFTTKNWREFEEHVFKLLKLLGIHKIYKFEDQKGRPDGFFIFRSLAVIYDCTLDEKFEESKAQQIENYCGQLKSGRLEYGETYRYTISEVHKKQVWIITRGKPRLVKKRIDGIEVKEVSVETLIKIYAKRLEENLDEEKLEDELIKL